LIKIKAFQWDERNERHILERHNVTKSEAEEVFMGDPYFRIGRVEHDMFTVKRVQEDICLVYIYIIEMD
jgi:uncharacterized DUF497 family protein